MEAILHIAIAQFVFGALLSLARPRKQLADYLLMAWFGLMAIFMGLALLKNLHPDSGWAKLQLFPFFFSLGPFLYLYVRALTAVRPRLDFADSLHMLPFVIFSVTAVTARTPLDEAVLSGNSFALQFVLYSVSALLSTFFYLFLTFRMLNRHRDNILEYFSYISDRISLGWIRAVVTGFTITIALTVLAALVNVFTHDSTIHPGYFLFIGFVVFAFGFTYYGTRQPSIYGRRHDDERFVDSLEEEGGIVEDPGETTEKYARSSLTPDMARQHVAAMEAYLSTEKPFLLRDLTLQDVAQALQIPPHHLTQAINEQLEKNFYTLVNEHRIEEVKRRLLDPKYGHLTVLAIAHDAGFNSKSSFNMTFKKHTGLTPSQFRAQG